MYFLCILYLRCINLYKMNLKVLLKVKVRQFWLLGRVLIELQKTCQGTIRVDFTTIFLILKRLSVDVFRNCLGDIRSCHIEPFSSFRNSASSLLIPVGLVKPLVPRLPFLLFLFAFALSTVFISLHTDFSTTFNSERSFER